MREQELDLELRRMRYNLNLGYYNNAFAYEKGKVMELAFEHALNLCQVPYIDSTGMKQRNTLNHPDHITNTAIFEEKYYPGSFLGRYRIDMKKYETQIKPRFPTGTGKLKILIINEGCKFDTSVLDRAKRDHILVLEVPFIHDPESMDRCIMKMVEIIHIYVVETTRYSKNKFNNIKLIKYKVKIDERGLNESETYSTSVIEYLSSSKEEPLDAVLHREFAYMKASTFDLPCENLVP